MIGYLKGTLVSKRPPSLTIEVAGVGYEVDAPMSTFYRLPEIGQPLKLITHLIVREDAHTLYGFIAESERELFRSLLKVTGVGARTALGVLSGMSAETFYQCIQENDIASLMKLPGVGRKTADRLVLEMADRVPKQLEAAATVETRPGTPASEALEALLTLGYRALEAKKMLKGLDVERLQTEELIREALRRAHASGGKA